MDSKDLQKALSVYGWQQQPIHPNLVKLAADFMSNPVRAVQPEHLQAVTQGCAHLIRYRYKSKQSDSKESHKSQKQRQLTEANHFEAFTGECFVLIHHEDSANRWILCLNDPVVAVVVARLLHKHDRQEIMDQLISLGISHVIYRREEDFAEPPGPNPRHMDSMRWRQVSHGRFFITETATAQSFKVYMRNLELFFEEPFRLRAALQCGGIIWRIAMEFLTDDLKAFVSDGPDEQCPVYGGCPDYWTNGAVVWRDVLSTDEVDYICGVYREDTGSESLFFCCCSDQYLTRSTAVDYERNRSWWPKPTVWDNCGLYTGYWTPACEGWYQRRREEIFSGKAQMHTRKLWHSKLRYSRAQTHKLNAGNTDLATAILDRLVPQT